MSRDWKVVPSSQDANHRMQPVSALVANRFKQPPDIYVRGKSDAATSVNYRYKSSLNTVLKQIPISTSFNDNIEYFKNLRTIPYVKLVNDPLNEKVDAYIAELTNDFKSQMEENDILFQSILFDETNKYIDSLYPQGMSYKNSDIGTFKNKSLPNSKTSTGKESKRSDRKGKFLLNIVEQAWNEKYGIDGSKIDENDTLSLKKYQSEKKLFNSNSFNEELCLRLKKAKLKFSSLSLDTDSDNFKQLCRVIKSISLRSSILFSVDIEAFERNSKIVTEIGISIYDPRENKYSITPFIRSYHLIVEESLFLRNSKIVGDHKNCFLHGESLVMPLLGCVEFIQSLINFYMLPRTEEDKTWERAFVGHDIIGDLKWLLQMGVTIPGLFFDDLFSKNKERYNSTKKNTNKNNSKGNKQDNKEGKPYANPSNDILNERDDSRLKNKNPMKPNLGYIGRSDIFEFDTANIYKTCYGEIGCGLGTMLRLFNIPHSYLHNGGNDAYYTLQILMRIGDINFRKVMNLDDLRYISKSAHEVAHRQSNEPKIVPSSSINRVVDALREMEPMFNNNDNSESKGNKSKRKIAYQRQTEFGGACWFEDPNKAFLSTIRNTVEY
ncbi:hypothetical protein Kpol_2000p100 [Vanderwaltozyma polyspora DSM 70294]|uniref:Gfd2/YDR514C-like C-terminal domain-containing protein n=1 Tax=Vanderwaltozyma polyspora (strain ATCC 22028 / DSM 70294 / BCRC 21397 / CBS 2163 / NBRC 10782 / NRRL Y-8283 / UCD 57-17) TaxID=436907 RepID=A7TFA7_VANPO|nr:uncharacterized protein Kpol_2000p100 [Vanderwaltozyma polyspora DSM 70294]EDO19132.1 hypothetical protein Kpol_2000p100 [Vanderwaltozyma polyspora DSM 70294]